MGEKPGIGGVVVDSEPAAGRAIMAEVEEGLSGAALVCTRLEQRYEDLYRACHAIV